MDDDWDDDGGQPTKCVDDEKSLLFGRLHDDSFRFVDLHGELPQEAGNIWNQRPVPVGGRESIG